MFIGNQGSERLIHYITMLKLIKGDLNKYKDIHVHGVKDLILLIWLYYPKQYTDSM